MLRERLRAEPAGHEHASVWATLGDGRVLLLGLLYFLAILGLYGLSFWLPQLIRTLGIKDPWRAGLLSAIPYAVATVVMVLVGQSSDRTGEHRWHLIGSAVAGALGLVAAGAVRSDPVVGMIAFSVAAAGILSIPPIFWTFPTTYLRGASAAAGIAAVNSFGNLAGFVSPYMIGAVTDATGEATMGLYALAASMVVTALLALVVTRHQGRPATGG